MTTRITYFDSLRGIAIIAVVFIHSLNYNSPTYELSIFFRQLINFAVPLFLSISGYFLVNKEVNTSSDYFLFLKKQVARVYFPYLFWSAGFIVLYVFVIKSYDFVELLKMVVYFQTAPIFYYIALIIQYYLLFPLFKNNLRVWFYSSILISLTIAACLPILRYYNISLPLIVYAGNFLTWLMFFMLGMFLRKNKLKINVTILSLLAILFLYFSNLETYYQIHLLDNVKDAVSAVKVSSFIYSSLVITLLLNFPRHWTIFSDLGKVSYAIFLMHMLILPIVRKVSNKLAWLDGLLMDLLCGTITILVCYLICLILRKVNPSFSQKYLGV